MKLSDKFCRGVQHHHYWRSVVWLVSSLGPLIVKGLLLCPGPHVMIHTLTRNHRYTMEIPEPGCAIFILAWDSNWGSLGFPLIKITCGSSGVYVACIYCGLSVKISVKTLHGARRWRGRQKPEDPQFEPLGWRCHYTGWYTRPGISLVYLCATVLEYKMCPMFHSRCVGRFTVMLTSVKWSCETNIVWVTGIIHHQSF